MFSQDAFIQVSRKFVCVRLESYESLEHQKLVRSFLNGRFENTAFCLLSPDGKQRLSRSGRSPGTSLGRRGARDEEIEKVTIQAMEKVASQYKSQGDPTTPIPQDFHSFRQALNVASGDQRLLLFVSTPASEQAAIRKTISSVVGMPEIVGRFHVDFINKGDEQWATSITGVKSKSASAIFMIQSDKFGQKGTVLKQLPADASTTEIKTALLAANKLFANAEDRKIYRDHVSDGRRKGVYFEGGVEYGEDRDGDGNIDHRGGAKRKRGD